MNTQLNTNPKRTRSKFDETEDKLLMLVVSQIGTDNWKAVAEKMRGRTARQCRDRWKHYINPQTNTSDWSNEEDQRLLQAFHIVGRHWGILAKMFPGRTSIGIRNHVWKLLRTTSSGKQTSSYSNTSSTESGEETPEDIIHSDVKISRVTLPPCSSFPFPVFPELVPFPVIMSA